MEFLYALGQVMISEKLKLLFELAFDLMWRGQTSL